MKRDLELVRKLLIFFDEKPGAGAISIPQIVSQIEGYDGHIIGYHLVLLYEAGFLRCEPSISSTSDRIIQVLPFELTWNGHEFLAKIRNPLIWSEVKESIKNKGLFGASFDLVSKMADSSLRKHLGLD